MLTDDEINSKLRVAFNEESSDHARSEAVASLIAAALMSLQRIAAALEHNAKG
ncbi:hypothetical protein [Bradyrhizobium sp. CCBAU 11386]|uniref:hypothetical protein n=1 Tax=Bradyrhizobium sp. CCBAU 11386 TaxID=1630837 RepID=UPI0023028638|nr:hypothetical protein [Bradyrhizobium sp. CCBAU 11386]